jgi:hypothetical protein
MNDKVYKSFYLFLLNLGIVSLVLFVLHKLSLLRVDLIFNESWLFAILIFSFTFCIAVKDKLNRSRYLTNRNIETIFEVSPYFFLSILIILAVNQFLKLDFLISRNFHIVVLGIAFGFLAFYRNRDRIENELEDEKKKEEEKERDRANDFEYKFPGINRIWGIRSIVKWMYKEGWGYSLGLIAIVVLASFLYFYGIGNYGFQGDEYYHAKVANEYFRTGKLFSLGNQSYTRSTLTSLLPIASRYAFNFLHINATIEFIYRFPIVLFAIFNVIIVYLISKIYLSKKYSLIVTLLYVTEIWFIYFAKYLRFYALSLFFILLILFFNLREKPNKRIIFISLISSIILYFLLTNYFLILIVFLIGLLISVYLKDKDHKKIYFISIIAFLILVEEYIRNLFFISSRYNSAAFSWNFVNITLQIKWLLYNYPVQISLFFIGSFFIFNKLNKLYFYSLFNLLFFLFYVNNVSFNFSFRPIYFFLTPIMINSYTLLKDIFRNKKIGYFIFLILLANNIYQDFNFNISHAGDKYYPTKPIYEKMEVIEGQKDIADFITKYTAGASNVQVITLGIESLDQYIPYLNYKRYSYSNQNGDYEDLSSFKEFLNNQENYLIVIFASAYSNRLNKLYLNVYGREGHVNEISSSFANYIESSDKFRQIYLSDDGYSKVFIPI